MRLLEVCALSFLGMVIAGCSAADDVDHEGGPSGERLVPSDTEELGALEQASTVAAVWQCHYEYHDQPGKGWYYCCESGESVCISRYSGNNQWSNYVCNF